MLYDQPVGIEGAAAESWAAVREGIHAGAAASPVPVMVSSTLPELLDDDAAARFADAGIPADRRAAHRPASAPRRCARPPADPARLRAIAAAAARPARTGAAPLAEHEAKELLRSAGVPVVEGRLAAGEEDAAGAMEDLGPALVLKLSAPTLMHKSELRALALDLRSPEDVRAAYRRLVALGVDSAAVLVERMEPPGLELLVSARRDAVVPALVVGLGGVWTEIHDDVAVVPLPATPERVEAALRSLRGAGLLTGAPRRHAARPGRRRPPRRRRGRPAAGGGARPDRAQPGARARARRAGRGRAGRLAPLEATTVGIYRPGWSVAKPAVHPAAWLSCLAVERSDPTRITAFTDGVMAVAITLLVLNIEVPTVPDSTAGLEPRRPDHAARRLRPLVRARGTVLDHPPPPVRGGRALRRPARWR